MSAITGFFIAAGVVSAAFFALMLRADRIRDRRRVYASSSTGDTISSGNDGFSLLSWFSGGSSSSSSDDSCSSASSSYAGSSDSSSCSDGGGGDGGGGGGD